MRKYRLDLNHDDKSLVEYGQYLTQKALGHGEFTRFIVLTTPRSGSNLLMTFLDSHPDIYVRGEMLAKQFGRSVKELVDPHFRKQPKQFRAVGLKLFHEHPYDGKPEDAWKVFLTYPKLKIIFLDRKNKLKQYYSIMRANNNAEWYSNGSQSSKPTVLELDPEGFARYLRRHENYNQRLNEYFHDVPSIKMTYEDLAGDTEGVFQQVTDFLGVAPYKPESTLKKQNQRGLREVVANYDALKAHFAGTEHEAMFDE